MFDQPYHHLADKATLTHRIEESARVYLVLDPATNQWRVDGLVFDGHPLFGLDGGPEVACTEVDDPDHPDDHGLGCRALVDDAPDLPTGVELAALLGNAALEHLTTTNQEAHHG